AGEALNPDSTEMYAWGRLWLWGYGKHPPLTGWVARLWFDLFPTADWAMHALAVTTTGVAAWVAWLVARRVVEDRRAVAYVLLLLIYPIFNFRGARFNNDLLLVPMFLLMTWALLLAFEVRTAFRGALLGGACAVAVLTKYFALLGIGAIGLSAIMHPDRALFFRSPAPYLAALVFAVAITPHLIWLVQSDYAPFAYAGLYLEPSSYSPLLQAGRALRHQAALLLPVALALAFMIYRGRVALTATWNAVRPGVARHITVISALLAVLPPIAAIMLGVHFGVDWGIPLYTLLPLAVLGSRHLGLRLKATSQLAVIWAAMLVVGLAAAPFVPGVMRQASPQRYQMPLQGVAAEV